jgi:2-(1,2-epoxy-1,2-dihydrophenyl)acetyl-CoA isomerase
MTEPKLLVEAREGVMTLTLNRPDKLNAIDNDVARALLDAIGSAARDPEVRVVLLNGSGRAFCAGRDITNPPTEDDLVLVQAVSTALVGLPKPVVVAVHGWTVGAGFEWAMNADIAFAAANTRFKLPEASIGVFVTGGLTATLPAYAGLARARALMLLGEEFSAADAQAWGLIWRVVPEADLDSASRAAARKLAALQPAVAGRFKKVLNEVGLARFERAIGLENESQRALGNSG